MLALRVPPDDEAVVVAVVSQGFTEAPLAILFG
jgi:hypothetical protein